MASKVAAAAASTLNSAVNAATKSLSSASINGKASSSSSNGNASDAAEPSSSSRVTVYELELEDDGSPSKQRSVRAGSVTPPCT